jgi:hypothetical protein
MSRREVAVQGAEYNDIRETKLLIFIRHLIVFQCRILRNRVKAIAADGNTSAMLHTVSYTGGSGQAW